jgi:translocation and assembly module TamB
MKVNLGYPAVTRGLDFQQAPLEARLDAQRFDVRGLSGVTPAVRAIAGLVTASVTARGTLRAPQLTGRLEWTDGLLALTDFGEYRNIHLTAHGDDDGVVLDELTAANGAGHARLTASAKRAGPNRYDVTADAKLDHLPLYRQGQPMAVMSLTAKVHGHAASPDTRLDIDIDDARVELPDRKHKDLQAIDEPRDVILMDGDQPLNRAQAAKLRALTKTARAPAPPARPPSLRLRVNSPRQLWVTGKDAYLELGLSPNFRVAIGEQPEVFGQVTVRRGRIDVFGRRFDIKADSTLTFGGPPDHPDLDVRAEHVNTTENITVLLTAKGPIDKLAVRVTSPNRPDLSESQLYTLIVSGHLQLSGGAGGGSPTTQAASIVGGVLASQLQAALKDRLPFDVLTIDVGGQGLGGTKLEAGRYLTDRLYIGYIGRIASDPSRYQNRNAVHLEFQLSARWEIEAEYGDLGTGTGDLMWKKSY